MNYFEEGDEEGLKKYLTQYIPEDHAKELLDGICAIARENAKYYAETGQVLVELDESLVKVRNTCQDRLIELCHDKGYLVKTLEASDDLVHDLYGPAIDQLNKLSIILGPEYDEYFLNGDEEKIIRAIEQYVPRSKAESLLSDIKGNCDLQTEYYINNTPEHPTTRSSGYIFLRYYLDDANEILEELCEKTKQPELKEFFQNSNSIPFIDVEGVREGKIRMEFEDGTVIYYDDPAADEVKRMSDDQFRQLMAEEMIDYGVSVENITESTNGTPYTNVSEVARNIAGELAKGGGKESR